MRSDHVKCAADGAAPAGCLLRTATGFSVIDGHGFSLATHELERSSILRTAFDNSEEGSRVPVRLTHSQLAQWYAYVRSTGQEGEHSTDELQQILKVSSASHLPAFGALLSPRCTARCTAASVPLLAVRWSLRASLGAIRDIWTWACGVTY